MFRSMLGKWLLKTNLCISLILKVLFECGFG
jgi:hypothetical protein